MKKQLWIPMILLVIMLSVSVQAEDESVWTFDTVDYTLDGYSGAGGDVVIPDTIQGCPVDIIGSDAFNGVDTVTSITFPETVKQLENSAGGWCSSLTQITLPQSLLVIGQNCFASDPALTEITIPSGVCYIDKGAFGFCSGITSVTFEGECPVIAPGAFTELAQDAVAYVPDDQVEAYTAALEAAGSMLSVQSSGQNAVRQEPVSDLENITFDAATGTITQYSGFSARLDVPEAIDGVPVTSIGPNAFQGNRYLCYVTLPEGLTTIEDEAFMDAATLLYVKIPSTLKSVGDRAFCHSYRGFALELPEGLEYIGDEAFVYAAVEGSLNLPEGLTNIGDNAFYNCQWMNRVYMPSTVKYIGENAFASCSISYVYIDAAELPYIAESAFAECTLLADIDLNTKCTKQEMLDVQQIVDNLGLSCRVWRNQNPDVQYCDNNLDTYIESPDGASFYMTGYTGEMTNIRPYDEYSVDGSEYKPVTGLADGAFKGNQTVKYFSVPYNDVFTYIGSEAFADSVVETVDLFDSVTTIGDGAFRNCQNLNEIKIPDSVTTIGAGAFENCQNLKEIKIPDSVTTIGAGAFKNCQNLEAITLSESVTSIGACAFEGTQITSLVIPADLEVNVEALSGIGLEGIRMSDYATDEQLAAWNDVLDYPWYDALVRESEESAFAKMPFIPASEEYFDFDAETGTVTGYTGTDIDVVIPRTIGGVEVKKIARNAFECARDYTDTEMGTNQDDWLHLRSLVIPETVTDIEDSAFEYCQQLETVICYGPLENTGRGTFYNNRSLKTVVFVNGTKMLDNYLFDGCSSLTQAWYKGKTDYVGEDCFRGCGMESLVVNAKQIGATAFRECTNLKEIHVRDGVESFSASAFYGCTSLSVICFDFTDAEVFDTLDSCSGDCAADLVMKLPTSASDEALGAFYSVWEKGNLGPVADESHVIKEDCTVLDPEKPDVIELMSPYDVTYDSSMVPAKKAEKPDAGTEKQDAVQETPDEEKETSSEGQTPSAAAGGDMASFTGVWNAVKIVAEDMELNLADLGMVMQMTLNADGTVQITDNGEVKEASWTFENGIGHIDNQTLTLTEDGMLCVEENGEKVLFERIGDA